MRLLSIRCGFPIAALCALVLWSSEIGPQAQGAADLALINGTVLTVDASDSIAQAVAVAGGRITAVGTTEQIRSHIGGQPRSSTSVAERSRPASSTRTSISPRLTHCSPSTLATRR